MMDKQKSSSKAGYSLLELSIALVIIGLLTGGILMGRELILSAEVKGTASDIEKMQIAYNAFFDKYGCVPGDCTNQTDFFDVTENGDGDGLIECDSSSGPWCTGDISEMNYTFKTMHEAGLIRSDAGTATSFEPTKLRDCQIFIHYENYTGNMTFLYGARTANYMQITQNLDQAPWHMDCMTPTEGKAIDKKIDDTYASTGKALGVSRNGASNLDCATVANNAGPVARGKYDISKDDLSCTMYVRLGN